MRRLVVVAVVATLVCELGKLLGAPEKPLDLAAIVGKKEAESTLGEAVSDAQSRNGEGADGYYSRCNYYSVNPGRSLVLRVRQASGDQLAPVKQLEELIAGSSRIKPMSGVGDKAAVSSERVEKGLSHVLMLYVAKGNAFVTVGINGVNDEKTALETARTLARKILAKL